MPEYPEIITKLTKKAESDELRHFDLSSFMSGPSLDDVFERIDKTMKFFTVFIYKERLDDALWEDKRYVDKKKVHLCSLVEEKVRTYWWERNHEHLKRIDEHIELLKSDPRYSKMTENELRDKAIKDLDQEIFPLAIKWVKEEYQEIYENEWEEYWKKEDPFKERVEYRYHRRYDMPPPFSHWDNRNPWQQYYFYKDHDGSFFYTQGGSGSSDQRYNHGFYGHLFALLNNKKKVPTYFFTYNSRNQFISSKKEESLWLHFFDLVGNFKIDWKKSREILKTVNEIRDDQQP